MKKRQLHSAISSAAPAITLPAVRTTISHAQLCRYAAGWILDCKSRQLSPATITLRELVLKNLNWYLESRAYTEIGTAELRQFFAYFYDGHGQDGGRWGNERFNKPVRPSTVKTYHAHLCVLFKWIVDEGGMDVNPMASVPPPRVRQNQIEPFTDDQVDALLAAARTSAHPRRDEAILLLLLDTGLRVSEVSSLKRGDLDMISRKCMVLGKGNKFRAGFFGRSVSRALNAYMREERTKGFGDHDPLFLSDRGRHAGQPLTRSGIQQLCERLGERAGIETRRCTPHTFRHTFSVNFLRAGGTVFALKEILGHTDLKMTQRYVNFAAADIEAQHREFSPVDRMRRRS